MDEKQERRLAELTEYTRADLARRDGEVVAGEGRHVHIHHHYPPPAAPAPVREMDIASKYAGHFVLAVWGMIALAGVAVVFVMIAQALMMGMISMAVAAVAVAVAVRSLRGSKADSKIMEQRLSATAQGPRSRPKR